MERKMIYQDEAAVESWKEQRQIQNQDIMEFGLMLKEDNIELNQEIFRQFVKEGSEFVWSLLEKEIEANAKKAGITSRIGKKNLMRGINERSEKYKEPHATILAGFNKCQNTAEEITIVQGKAILTKEELERKRQELSIFIETDEQLKLWNLLQNICKGLNDLEKFVSKEKELRSIFAGGSLDNLNDYIYWQRDTKVQLTKAEERFGAPLTGGMIFMPDPEAVEALKTEEGSTGSTR